MSNYINPYEIFLKVVELKNITKAAEALNYTQSGISHAIASLEKELGLTLFVRSKRGVHLTRNGEAIVDEVQSLVNHQRNLEQRVSELKSEVSGTIRVGTYLSISVIWLPTIIRSFQQKYPLVEFELVHGNNVTTPELLLQGKIDCAFMTVPSNESVKFHALHDDPMLVALPPDHPLSSKDVLSLEDIIKEEFILPIKGSDVDILNVLSKIKAPLRKKYILNDDMSMMSMVSNGFGISIIPELLLRICDFGLVVKPLEPPQFRTAGIAFLDEKAVSTTTRIFIEYVVNSGELDYSRL